MGKENKIKNIKNYMIHQEEMKKLYEEMFHYEQEKYRKWEEEKNKLKNLIHPKYIDFIETNEGYSSEGIVEIELTDIKERGYPNTQCCKIKDEKVNFLFLYHKDYLETLDGDSKYEGEEIEYYVWQTSSHIEDDYIGLLLLPLLDGKKYWQVRYSC